MFGSDLRCRKSVSNYWVVKSDFKNATNYVEMRHESGFAAWIFLMNSTIRARALCIPVFACLSFSFPSSHEIRFAATLRNTCLFASNDTLINYEFYGPNAPAIAFPFITFDAFLAINQFFDRNKANKFSENRTIQSNTNQRITGISKSLGLLSLPLDHRC